MENKYIAQIPQIWFTVQSDGSVRLHWGGNSTPCYDMESLVKEVGELIGRGSYLKRTRDGSYPKDENGSNIEGSMGFGNDQLKGAVLEAAYNACKEAGWPVTISTFFIQFYDIID